VLSRDEFVDLFLDDLELPDLAKRKLAEAESEGFSAPAIRPGLAGQYFGQPHRAQRDGAAGRAAAAAAGEIAELEAENSPIAMRRAPRRA
jgi:uncharacterized sporulation protein YeaH/YhbH (DUF444 family)